MRIETKFDLNQAVKTPDGFGVVKQIHLCAVTMNPTILFYTIEKSRDGKISRDNYGESELTAQAEIAARAATR